MKCRFCNAELPQGASRCPICGRDSAAAQGNAQTSGNGPASHAAQPSANQSEMRGPAFEMRQAQGEIDTQTFLQQALPFPLVLVLVVMTIVAAVLWLPSAVILIQSPVFLLFPFWFLVLAISLIPLCRALHHKRPISCVSFTLVQIFSIVGFLALCCALFLPLLLSRFSILQEGDLFYKPEFISLIGYILIAGVGLAVCLLLLVFCTSVKRSIRSNVPQIRGTLPLFIVCIASCVLLLIGAAMGVLLFLSVNLFSLLLPFFLPTALIMDIFFVPILTLAVIFTILVHIVLCVCLYRVGRRVNIAPGNT